VFCKDPEKNYQCVLTEKQASYYLNSDGTVTGANNSFWGRVEGAYGRYQPAVSTSGAQYDSSLQKVQVGLDGLLVDGERGRLIGGVTATYGHVSADITTANSRGNIRADGYGVGGTITWYGTNGFYADAQAQATWFTSDLNSTTLERGLVNGNKGFGYALSGEIGQRITLNQHWTMTPQLQLIYLDTRFDSFTDRYGAAVSLSDGDSLRGRLGLAVEYQRRWKQADNTFSRVSAYGIANLTNEFLNGTRVDVSGTVLASRDDRLWGGFGMGGSYNWDNDRYAVFGQLLANTSLAHFGDSFEVGGTVGLRVRW
jgi:outer membrane autotransporter protein